MCLLRFFFFFQAEDGIRDIGVTGVQTCALRSIGCFLSGFLLAIRVPTIVTIDDKESVRLFTASIVIAIEPDIIPNTTFIADKNKFVTIPIIPVLIICPCLLSKFIKYHLFKIELYNLNI